MKLIIDFQVTPANVTDREIGEEMIETMNEGDTMYGDRGYPSQDFSKKLKKQRVNDAIMRKGSANHPISENDKKRNIKISKTRCRVEHVFGYQKRHLKKYDILSIGLVRATAKITLSNVLYNINRVATVLFCQLTKVKLAIA